MKILLTGGTGLIGSNLISCLLALRHKITVLTRSPEKASQFLDPRVTLWKRLEDQQNLNDFEAVINLAGEPIADKRWTYKQKQLLCNSRWSITQRLVNLFQASKNPPSVMISGSAIGYYGNLDRVVVTEDTLPHDEFTHKLCARWEQIAYGAQSDKTRVCLLRTGVVLTPKGGFLAKILPLFRRGLGGIIGNGYQYISWIHIDDMINGIIWLLENDLCGPFNMVSPNPITNKHFTHTLGCILHRPTIIRFPAAVVCLVMGESAVLLLGGQHALPKRLEATGFNFRWHDLTKTLLNLLS